MLFRSTELVIGAAVTGVVLLITPKGKRAPAFIGCMVTSSGIVSLAEGRIVQRWRGGPPIEGPLATVFSIVLLGVGLYIISLAFVRNSDDHTKGDGNQQT